MGFVIKPAEEWDVPAILAITNQAIRETTALWVSAPYTYEERLAWFRQRRDEGFPVLVAHEAGQVLGFGSYGHFRVYEGYSQTVEHSVYVDADSRKRGVGRALLEALADTAARQGLHVMIGAITADNAASVGLHEQCGFVRGGVLPEVGRKFGNWLDLLFMYKLLSMNPDIESEQIV
ncbi:GNAT family N-acetyltransferase [Acetobacter oeni]|uniref:N-acetyltransferase n=1 Tax=Acetobacter oeni TaxID=304077 RepID=A0A511XII5_9PROT|nr:GNAT family N-acetyltransferase [Acetobacter oeni]MBB3881492.1 phosphinothricin acetyltransferase [Acetobacter oeni]NHO18356.1 GNAT family N-acetyltransferase [Acetobacter oeni]GBR10833.1 acetyltransferase [Acetobacter oeni LMG 21952]GEN62768.1 N-acetyltransferase [Acetobacter oeni]